MATDINEELKKIQSEIDGERYAYRAHILDLAEDTPDPKFLFSVGGVPTIPAGELIGIKGRAKQGKSQFMYLLIGEMLKGGNYE